MAAEKQRPPLTPPGGGSPPAQTDGGGTEDLDKLEAAFRAADGVLDSMPVSDAQQYLRQNQQRGGQ